MKQELINPIYIEFYPHSFPTKQYLGEVAKYVKEKANIDGPVDVSKCLLNSTTYDKHRAMMLEELYTTMSRETANNTIAIACLIYGFACDMDNKFNIPDNVIAVEQP